MIEKFSEGSLDEYLIKASISERGSVILRGSAKLYFTPRKQYCYVDMTSSGHTASDKFFGAPATTGGYLFKAFTKTGSLVRCEIEKLIPRTMYSSTELYDWHFRPFKIRLETERADYKDCSESRVIRSRVYSIEDSLWFQKTKSVTDGMSRHENISWDWSRFEVLDCEFRVGQGIADSSVIEMAYPATLSTEKAIEIYDAFLHALSLRVGGAIRCLGKTWASGKQQVTELYNAARGNSRHRFSIGAFGFHHVEDEESRFLRLATEYFSKNKEVFPMLDLIWDAELFSNGSRNWALGVAVETFCDFWLVREKSTSLRDTLKDFKSYKERILEILKGLEVEHKDSHHHERILNYITAMHAAHAKEKIRQVHSDLGLQCFDKELISWGKMRNFSAHSIRPRASQSVNSDYWRVRTLFFRLVLKDMGWDGPYYNLSGDTASEENLPN